MGPEQLWIGKISDKPNFTNITQHLLYFTDKLLQFHTEREGVFKYRITVYS